MAQVVEHVLGKDEVTSSNLVSSSKNSRSNEREFFYPLRKQWHIINDSVAIVVSHQSVRTVYHHALACIKNFRNDDIQN